MKLSIVSPVYKAEKIVVELVSRIITSVELITSDFEIILVEDCGPDNSWTKIIEECKKDSRIKGIKLSRNFGQHYAITAGLSKAKGDWIVVMDCDLQDDPEEIINLYNLALKGSDIVLAKRIKRQDNLIKRLSSKFFYQLFSFLTDTKQDPTIANFGIYRNIVIKSILNMKDQVRYFPAMVQWVGFRKDFLNVRHNSRYEGKTSYSWSKLFNLAFDNIVAFSNKPLKLTIRLGLLISIFSFFYGIYYIILFLQGKIEVLGFTSIIISISFFSGVIIFILGIIGLYLGKAFDNIKSRPTYIIDQKINLEYED